jgi:hypothetical protein
MQKIRNILLLIATVVAISSCREPIDLTLDTTYRRLVVEGSITNQAVAHRVVLSYTSDYLTSEPPVPATGAMVEITDGQSVFLLTEVSPGVYQTAPSVMGVIGREYTLTIRGLDVDNDGETETYAGSDLLKPVMLLDSVVLETQKPLTTPPVYKINGWGQEPPTPDDCYQWVYFLNGSLQTDTLDKTIFVDDTFVNGAYLPGLTMFMDVKAIAGDTILVETRSLTRRYYDFLVTLMLETSWNQGGGAGPPSNIKGNMSNGAIGYFAAHAVSQSAVVVK